MSARVLLPGDQVETNSIYEPQSASRTLTVGPGLRYAPPHTVQAVFPGYVTADARKNAIWLENSGYGKYVPAAGDLVIATVHHSSTDYWQCAVTDYTPFAALPQLAFEGVTKKTRPQLAIGSVVYARVSMASRHMDPELECVHPSTGKSEGLGELKGGMIYDISLGMARRLLMNKTKEEGGVSILEDLGSAGLKFEIAVGRNGKIWIKGNDMKTTLLVGNGIQQADEKTLDLQQQSKLAKKLVRP